MYTKLAGKLLMLRLAMSRLLQLSYRACNFHVELILEFRNCAYVKLMLPIMGKLCVFEIKARSNGWK
jgi:hypothetical protein